jgi:hypothetical protein
VSSGSGGLCLGADCFLVNTVNTFYIKRLELIGKRLLFCAGERVPEFKEVGLAGGLVAGTEGRGHGGTYYKS